MTEERWRQLTYWPLIIASVVFIVAYSWQVIADLQGPAELVARLTMTVTWVVFAVDYLVRLRLASPRGPWVPRRMCPPGRPSAARRVRRARA